jgi:Ecdysteroid kinase-like family
MTIALPYNAEGLTPEVLTAIANQANPGARISGVKLVKLHEFGDGDVSTSARATLDLDYAEGSCPDLPRRVMVKMSFDSRNAANNTWNLTLHGLFRNEVNFYNKIRPQLDIEAPRVVGGYYEEDARRFVLVMEDMRERGVHFPSVLEELSIENVQNVLDTHARLHASFWESPRFSGDLSWVETHLSGRVESMIRGSVAEGVRLELAKHKFKREVLSRLGITEKDLFAGMCVVKQHQATLPRTLLHGDSHVGNTYRTPDGTGGLYDWQLCVRGFALHDITYVINTALSVEQRRQNERELLAFYRDRLRRYGVANPPATETLWLEHRRATLWTLYIGWLTCPPESYGWDTVATALFRVSTAFEDHGTQAAVAALM